MNERYKFRAWLKKEKKMVEVVSINFNDKVIAYNDYEKQELCINCSFEDVELMQYVGREDLNDNEIFEDDIVKVRLEYESYDGYREEYRLCLVIHDNKMCQHILEYIGDNDGNYYSFCETIGEDLEIIGNKYQHPELLEENNA